VLKLIHTSGSDDPILDKIAMARVVNSVCLGAVVTPWDVYDLSEEWLMAFTLMHRELNKR